MDGADRQGLSIRAWYVAVSICPDTRCRTTSASAMSLNTAPRSRRRDADVVCASPRRPWTRSGSTSAQQPSPRPANYRWRTACLAHHHGTHLFRGSALVRRSCCLRHPFSATIPPGGRHLGPCSQRHEVYASNSQLSRTGRERSTRLGLAGVFRGGTVDPLTHSRAPLPSAARRSPSRAQ